MINKEGYKIILTVGGASLLIAVILFMVTPPWCSIPVSALLLGNWLFTLWFFREPRRPYISDDGTVFAPADGRIVVVEKVFEHEYLKQDCIQVSVFMSLCNVHINWFPVGGRIEYFKYHPGEFLVAWHPKSSQLNERTTTVIDTGRHKVLFRQIAGYVARRIVSYATVGVQVKQNEKCGFIKFGSRIDLLLPAGTEVLVKIDDRVTGSQTPLARLPR